MLKSTPLNEQAYEHLQKMIDNNELEEGIKYSETKLTEQIGVSRTPIRDALQKLEQEGYIEILPSRGFQLQSITPKRIQKNNQMRSALEGYSALMLTQNRCTAQGQETIRRLGDLIAHQKIIFEAKGSVSDFLKHDFQFHLTLVEFLENDELSKIFCNHMYCFQKLAQKSLMHPGRLEETIEEHTRIYDAICAGDVTNVYSVTMRHMQTAADINLAELPCSKITDRKQG